MGVVGNNDTLLSQLRFLTPYGKISLDIPCQGHPGSAPCSYTCEQVHAVGASIVMFKALLHALLPAIIFFFRLAQAVITLEFYSDEACQTYLETDNITDFIDRHGCWRFRNDVLNVAGLLADFSSGYPDGGCKLNIYSKDDCSKASLFKTIGDGSSCADLSTAKGVGLDCPPGTGSDGSLATVATSTQDPSAIQVRPLSPTNTLQESLTQSQLLTGPYASGSSAMASSNMRQILSQDLHQASLPSSRSTLFSTSTPSEMPHAQPSLTSVSTSTNSSAMQAKISSTSRSDPSHNASDTSASRSNHNLSVNGEIVVGTVIPGLAILVAIIIGIDQRKRMRRGQGNVVNVFLDGTRRFSRHRPSPAGNSRRTWPGC